MPINLSLKCSNNSCKQYQDRPAFYNLGVTLTYAQIDKYSRDFAAYLQQEFKLKKGDQRCDYAAEYFAISCCHVWRFASRD